MWLWSVNCEARLSRMVQGFVWSNLGFHMQIAVTYESHLAYVTFF
jgi:hypothetical protein